MSALIDRIVLAMEPLVEKPKLVDLLDIIHHSDALVNAELALPERIKPPFDETMMNSPDYHGVLARAMLDHDFINVIACATQQTVVAMVKKDEGEEFILALEEAVSYINVARKGLLLIPYCATGDSRYCLDYTLKENEHFSSLLVKGRKPLKYSLPTDIAYTVVQFLKNAQAEFWRAQKEGLTVDIDVSLEWDISVQDTGRGIAPELLPQLFGAYTTGGSGVGLQVAKRFAELRHGFIEVLSTIKDQPTFRYDTLNQKVEEVEQEPVGSKFTLQYL